MTSEEAGIKLPPTCSCCNTRPLITTGHHEFRCCPYCDRWPSIVTNQEERV